jgi:hypothetical protein
MNKEEIMFIHGEGRELCPDYTFEMQMHVSYK